MCGVSRPAGCRHGADPPGYPANIVMGPEVLKETSIQPTSSILVVDYELTHVDLLVAFGPMWATPPTRSRMADARWTATPTIRPRSGGPGIARHARCRADHTDAWHRSGDHADGAADHCCP